MTTDRRAAAPSTIGTARSPLWPLALGTFAIGVGGGVITGLLPTMSVELGVSYGRIGALVGVYGVSYAVTAPLVAVFGRRLPPRAMMLSALAAFAVLCLLTGLATDYTAVALLRGAAAVVAGGFTPTATVLASRIAPPGRRGRAVATVFGGLTAATVLAAPVGTVLGPTLGYRGVYALVGVCALVAVLAVALLVRVPAAPRTGRGGDAADGRRWSPLVLVVLGVSAIETVAAFTVQTYAVPLLALLSGADAVSVSAVLIAYGLAGVLGNVVGGRLADRLGPSVVLIAALAGATLAVAALPWLGTTSWGAGAVFAIWGFSAWASNSPLQALLLAWSGRHGRLAVALNSSVIAVGTAGGSLVGGLLVDADRLDALPLVSAGIMAGSAGVLVVLLAFAGTRGSAVTPAPVGSGG